MVGRLASNPDTVGSAKGGPIPAAQYVRMSTEHQRCSTENQSDAILQFVSVTQQFNTTSSMGRLTLNVLLSFAQFEREVTGERIRDKIAASKKKGMWMGGNPPLGYHASERTLVIHLAEAKTVRHLFTLYLQLGCVRRVKDEADRLGLKTKRRTAINRVERGGKPFSRGHIHRLLSNPIYTGRIAHKGQLYPGQHPALIEHETWTAVRSET
ncbi:MAG TPA: recombinase family protein [Stellaceae bacterium]|nr:recombinase family protein [Stellaceae bacterium]